MFAVEYLDYEGCTKRINIEYDNAEEAAGMAYYLANNWSNCVAARVVTL